MNLDNFIQNIQHPELLNDRTIGELEQIIEEFPFFQSARLMLIKNLKNQGSIKYDRELRKTAVWTTDRKKLFHLLDHRVLLPVNDYTPQLTTLIKHEPQLTKTNKDSDVIYKSGENLKKKIKKDAHLSKNFDELDELIKRGSAASGPFFDVGDKVDLADFKNTFNKPKQKNDEDNNEPLTRKDQLIDNFIINQPKINPIHHEDIPNKQYEPEQQEETSDMFTDTLATIYIKQGFYEKAINAYEKLSLKYPKKNSYFAAQIIKVKDLINNQ